MSIKNFKNPLNSSLSLIDYVFLGNRSSIGVSRTRQIPCSVERGSSVYSVLLGLYPGLVHWFETRSACSTTVITRS